MLWSDQLSGLMTHVVGCVRSLPVSKRPPPMALPMLWLGACAVVLMSMPGFLLDAAASSVASAPRACVLLRYTSPINGFAVMLWLVVSRACRPSALSYRKTRRSCRRFAADCGTSRCRVLRGRQSRRCCRSSVPSTTPLRSSPALLTSFFRVPSALLFNHGSPT